MQSADDVKSLYSFLNQTPEGPLRKMLVGKDISEMHFRVLVKLAKGGPEAEFVECYMAENFGKLRLSTKENVLKETFWGPLKAKFLSLGLIGAAKAA